MDANFETLRHLVPLGRIDVTAMKRLASAGRAIHGRKGDTVFDEVNDKGHCYYLLSGELKLTDIRGKTRTLSDHDEPRYPLDPESPHSRSARVASSEAHLLRFDDNDLYALILKQFSLLNQLDEKTLKQLVQQSQILDLGKNEQIYSVGSMDGHLYYLLHGTIRMTDREGKTANLDTGTEQASFAFGSLKPRPANAIVESPRALIACLDNKAHDTLITWQGMVGKPSRFDTLEGDPNALGITGYDMDVGVEEISCADNEWLMTLLRCQSFFKVPPENVQLLAEKMEPVKVSAGDIVIQQNDPGDYYYVIREGRCKVIHNGKEVDEMGPTEAFGEEALISGNPRNSTIQMIKDGVLMRLSKADFDQLLAPPLISKVSTQETVEMVREGAVLLDVRSREEYKHSHLIRSVNLPLNLLRVKLEKLKAAKDKTFIVYCDSGIRSSAASFLLKQAGFNVHMLKDPQEAFQHLLSKQE